MTTATPSTQDLELVLAHMKARQRSGPTPATGLHWMTDQQYRACVAALRDQGYEITETTVAGGDRAANETGYLIVAEPPSSAPVSGTGQ